MKEIEAIMMVSMIVFSAFAFAAPVTAENNVISIGDVEAQPGESKIKPILISNAANIAGIEINLSYDPAVVNVTDAAAGDFNDYFYFDNSKAAEGYVRIGAMKFGGLSGDKIVANVELTAVGDAGSKSNLNISIIHMTDPAGNEVAGTTENGTFKIQGDVNPPIVKNPQAEPKIIPEDTDNEPLWGESANLSVSVTDDSVIRDVTINLSAIGGKPVTYMTNIGNYTEDSVLWCVFNFTTNASVETAGWNGTAYEPYQLVVNATDKYGNSNISVSIELIVMKNGDVTSDGKVNFGDGLRIINHYFHPEDPSYSLPSDTIADVTGDGKVNFGDGLRIINHYFHPEDPSYILK